MHTAALLVRPLPGWADPLLSCLHPGANVAVLTSGHEAVLEARQAGLVVRDTLLVMLPAEMAAVVLLRAPLTRIVAMQVIKTGSGGLWIDACRISTTENLNGGAYSAGGRADKLPGDERMGAALGMFDPGAKPDRGFTQPTGRWPTNLVLVHGVGCRCEGTKKVKASNPTGQGCGDEERVRGVYMEGDPNSFVGNGGRVFYGKGTETVAAWQCEAACPVAEIDSMSGTLKTNAGSITPTMASMGFHGGSGSAREVKGDSGGASRFYPQFASEADMLSWIAMLLGGDPLRL